MNDNSPRHGDYGHDCWEGCSIWAPIRLQHIPADDEAIENYRNGILDGVMESAAAAVVGSLITRIDEMRQAPRPFADHCSRIYDWATNGRISKPNTSLCPVCGAIKDMGHTKTCAPSLLLRSFIVNQGDT